MDRIEKHIGPWVLKHRWWIIIATILFTAGATSGARLLTFNNDTRVFFSERNPQLRALEELENTYTKNQNVFFVIAPANNDVFTRQTLAAVEALTVASWEIPYSNRVDSVSNFQHTWAKGDELIVEDLVEDAANLSDAQLSRIRQVALSEPLLVSRLVSPSGHVTGVNVNTLIPGTSIEEVPLVADFAQALADDLREKHPEISVYLTGSVMADNAFGEAGKNDMETLLPLMFLVLIAVTGLALRSLTGTVVTVIVILLSTATGMGFAGWLQMSLNPASVAGPAIILTLAVADSVHILVTVFHRMALGKTKHEAIAESLQVNLQPVFLTSITTVIGFLSMNFSDAPPFRDLGNIVAMGVTAAFFYSVLFMPALLAVLPVRVKAAATETECPPCDRLAGFVIRHCSTIFWSAAIIAAVFAAGTLRIQLNDDFIEYFDESFEIRRATDFMEAELTGADAIEYSLRSKRPDGINDPEYLATVERFAAWYREQPKVVHVNTIVETMKRLNMNMHEDDEDYYRIPSRRDLAAQYLLLYEMSLPFGLDLNNQINVDKSASRMIVTLTDMTTRELRQMDEEAREWLRANAPESMLTHGSGLSIIWAHISGRNIKQMLSASFGALLLISVLLVVALRSWRLGLLSLIPNLAPAIMAFGVWGLLMQQVGLGLSVIVSMTLGIVVDDTVHFLSKYLRARREQQMTPTGAVRYAFNTVGTAMWVTTVGLVAGFLVLSFSAYRMSSDMGVMSALTISLALAMDFLLLPTLLIRGGRKQPYGSKKERVENLSAIVHTSDLTDSVR